MWKCVRRGLLHLIAWLACGLLVATVAVGWLGAGRLVEPPRRVLQDYHRERLDQPAAFGLRITAYTGPQQTPCLLVEPEPSRNRNSWRGTELRQSLQSSLPWGTVVGTVVMLHGHTGRKEDHLPSCERFCAAGFRCLLLDLPGHGDHPAPHATFGKKESALVEALVDDLPGRFAISPEPLFLYGVSQGAAIALQTAARHPERWAGVISVSSFAALDRTLTHSAEAFAPNHAEWAPLATASVGCAAWFRAGYTPWEIQPIRVAQKLTMPVMIVHGREDRFIPFTDAEALFSRIPSSRKVLRPVEGAGHDNMLSTDAKHLYPEMCRFLLEARSR
ncbi:pimeloyl-ACP methyl ester carboxylesterase [Haloferula luteola]|uniref:Pimeloyl-ACP methyl ester carboxylesterase n=1 Tax=Haloferula luteola TaxID=595692 RepID=A0A840UZG2_9BACT|nr:alpha/beta fold hydrolase [Haloferula luteola]MBB5350216.1 pimeloyl-ACP methyl ester carboxylesterase [Haloferula luteola]